MSSGILSRKRSNEPEEIAAEPFLADQAVSSAQPTHATHRGSGYGSFEFPGGSRYTQKEWCQLNGALKNERIRHHGSEERPNQRFARNPQIQFSNVFSDDPTDPQGSPADPSLGPAGQN